MGRTAARLLAEPSGMPAIPLLPLVTRLHHYLPLAPHAVHAPELDFKPHLNAGLEECLEETSPQAI